MFLDSVMRMMQNAEMSENMEWLRLHRAPAGPGLFCSSLVVLVTEYRLSFVPFLLPTFLPRSRPSSLPLSLPLSLHPPILSPCLPSLPPSP